MHENNLLKEKLEKKKRTTVIMAMVCIGLGILVIALFAVAFTGKHPNILNYENVILDKYSSWEQELTERENAIREKELSLKVNE